jgi:CDP-glucose 4,6-dehydratase
VIDERWRGRRVLVTGHTGFKGAWLALWLEHLGATTFGIALPAPVGGAFRALTPKLEAEVHADIRDRERMFAVIEEWRPDVVFHLAAQALVPDGYRDPVGTFETNVSGTVNVVSAAAAAGVAAVVVVTSDKVYANDGSGRAFTESDPLGGHDPYSASKACADIAARSLRTMPANDGTALAVARAGNVIGGGDVAPDRLLPDAWRALVADTPLLLRNPDAVRPWQFVLEPLLGYLLLGERLLTHADAAPEAVNFGPRLASCRPVGEVVDLAYQRYGQGSWKRTDEDHPPEATLLRLDATLAEDALGWSPSLTGLDDAVELTVDWWRTEAAGGDLRALASAQLERVVSGRTAP